MTARRIGILGGTFDPIHCGHLDVGRAAESALGLTEIVVIPSNIPPHRPQPVASSHHRFAMIALAISGRDGWRASDVELRVGSPSFTTGTLRHFQDRGFAATELFFIIGADAFAEIESWMDFPAILDRAHFAVVSRPGFPVGEMSARLPALAPRMTSPSEATSTHAAPATPSIFLINAATADVSATAIRRRAAGGESVAGLVPPAVGQHIEQHALYSAAFADEFGAGARRIPAAGRLHGQD
jgi:nicotinate-nucleotide adenylyltransferase